MVKFQPLQCFIALMLFLYYKLYSKNALYTILAIKNFVTTVTFLQQLNLLVNHSEQFQCNGL